MAVRAVNHIGSAAKWGDVFQTSKDQVAMLNVHDKMDIFAIIRKRDKLITKIF